MSIFEELESLNVSEECFNDIIRIIEELLDEKYTVSQVKEIAKKVVPQRMEKGTKEGKETGRGPSWKSIGRVHRAQNLAAMPDSDKDMREYQEEVKKKVPEIANKYSKAFKKYEDKVFRTGTDATGSREFKEYAEAADAKAKAKDVLSVGKPKKDESSISRYV